ncbi:carboxypeptidase regulatory-like domain-containing protein [Mucilaginibacter sp. Bleaf8]|uniref:carboxypeptidase-like regulatory domain-containing protein n=1 Tax=Mucilaginibacter sp. Bleaf8 TaxID=2834430 RepID=UPI001BCC4F7E|nr:carboxypeptidase-like regulatory domain-containing protein [Mucilaginibacter sp. Bleaf8]MBS7562963.1 carboxypeptidase regulatory-like domain-containing protein [Mucilaginibacter sp. Bleaf8]
MIVRNLLSSFILFIFAGALSASAQTDSVTINTVVDKTQKYLEARPTEKVYLHMDKPYYAVGDTIWFKAYVSADLHQPSPISKVVYIEVIARADSLVQLIKLPVRNSIAWGNIALASANYQQGNYRIRAYTKWMTNNEPSYFFDKTITVGNAIENKILTNITYNTNKSGKVNARILYKDQRDAPYGNRKVTWTVQNADGTLEKGKGTTDANGYLTLSISEKNAPQLKSASLVTVMDVENKHAVTRTFPLKNAAATNDVQFFPEGGDLVDGINSAVAFKAIRPDGLGTEVKGTVVDNEGKTVASITSQHLGMGIFTFTPESNKTYKANVSFPDGTQATYNLPKAKPSGLVLSIDNKNAASMNLKITANDAFLQANRGKSYYIIAQSSGAVCYAARASLYKSEIVAAIPKDKLRSGTVQVSILNTSGEPLSERLAFVWNAGELMNLSLTADKPTYARRQKVKLNLAAKAQSLPADANFSVSVIDETKTPFNDNASTTILTHLLLQSDVKGFIEQPNYYFTKTDEKKLNELDLLMLTQGYRHFTYKSIITGAYPPLYALPEQGIELSGTLRTLNGMPIKGGNVRLQIPNRSYNANAITNAEGEFKFENLLFEDSSQVTLNARNNVRANNLMIMVSPSGSTSTLPPNPNYPNEILNIDSTLSPYLQNSKRVYDNSHQLKEVVIKSTTIPKTVTHKDYAGLSGLSSIADHQVNGSQLSACNDLLTCIRGSLPGITFDNNFFYVTRDYNAGNRTPTQVFVRGMPVDNNYLSNINPSEVESIEIFVKDDLGTVNRTYNTNGAIVVNMKKIESKRITLAELQQLSPPPYIVNLMPKGYDAVKEFYSPKYDVSKTNTIGLDLRTTIYWNPAVYTNKTTGTASVEFFNADSKGTYKVIVEGWDKDGNLGRYVYRYKVE